MASVDDVATQLAAHERIMQDRYEHVEKGLAELKRAESAEGEKMSTVNVENPMGGLLPLMMGGGNWGGGGGAALGGGIGGGLLGGILGGALLNNNGGLLGNRGGNVVGNDFVTPAMLTSAINGVTDNNNVTTILQTLGDIKAAVPLAEGQVQLALAGAQADLNRNIDSTGDQITSQITAGQLSNANSFAATSRQLSDIIATSLASQNNINVNVLQSAALTREAVNSNGTANLLATERAATATALAVANSTKEILAALNAQDIANLQRQLTVAETTLARRETESLVRGSEININNSATATAQQIQMQTQQQNQFQILAQLAAGMTNLANDIQQVKQGSVVFNSGQMRESGNQSAANTNVRG